MTMMMMTMTMTMTMMMMTMTMMMTMMTMTTMIRMSLDWDATKSVSALYEWLPQKCYLVQIPPSRLFFFWLPTAVSDIAMM